MRNANELATPYIGSPMSYRQHYCDIFFLSRRVMLLICSEALTEVRNYR